MTAAHWILRGSVTGMEPDASDLNFSENESLFIVRPCMLMIFCRDNYFIRRLSFGQSVELRVYSEKYCGGSEVQ